MSSDDTLIVVQGHAPPYPVRIRAGVLAALPDHLPATAALACVISDETVERIHGGAVRAVLSERIRVAVFRFPAGEGHKTRATKAFLEDAMAAAGAGRDAVVIALGGGVTTDLAGFVAATWHRGIPWIALPTSLLAMADAAIGGKTGLDIPAGKNLIGAFHPPLAVLADTSLLATLPPGEVSGGLAEMVKHAVVGDERLLDDLAAAAGAVRNVRSGVIGPLLMRSVAVKAEIVAKDPEERDFRQVLNFGHTIGHAIEQASGWTIPHGRAVAAGMSVEAGIAVRMGLMAAADRDRIRETLRRLGLPAEPPAGLGAEAILAATEADKKVRAGRVRFALPEAVGRMARGPEGYAIPVPREVAARELATL